MSHANNPFPAFASRHRLWLRSPLFALPLLLALQPWHTIDQTAATAPAQPRPLTVETVEHPLPEPGAAMLLPEAGMTAAAGEPSPIPWSELGARANEQATGDALAIKQLDDGSGFLETKFQRLQARVEASQGLLIHSTREQDGEERGTPLRVVADVVRRAGGKAAAISRHGMVTIDEGRVRWQRPGLTEEYSVSVDGLRQDFLLDLPPAGHGDLRLELAVEGARATAAADGARLQLDAGRTLAYSRLHVEDANGRVLPARMEVVAADRIVLAVNDAAAVYPIRIDPTFSDANWISMGGLPGTDSVVHAVASDPVSGHIYVGGSFTLAGEVNANYIAHWDGSAWEALGTGMNNIVRALAVDGAGGLYAGGDFTTVDGAPTNYIAHWTSSAWDALGTGMNSVVLALTVDGAGNLYAGGDFTSAGGQGANYIAQWDGSDWSALGSGMNSSVWELAVDGAGNLFAGGDFTSAGGQGANYIAQWDGSAWSVLGAGMNILVRALAVDGVGNLYAGGGFISAGGQGANYIAQWDGSAWSVLGAGMNSTVYALAMDGAGNLYAGGDFTSAGGKVSAYLAKADISVRVSYEGNGHDAGATPDDSAYAPGTEITVLGAGSLARTGYTFSGWNTQADGSGTSLAVDDTFTIGSDDVTLHAQWALNSYTVSATAGEGGSITPASQAVNHGSSTSFTVTPDDGYTVIMGGSCGGSLSGNSYTTAAITATCTVTAQFEPIFRLEDGDGQSLGDQALLAGDAVTFILTDGSGDYEVMAGTNTNGVSGTLQDNGDSSYSFIAPSTGAFAGDYLITVTDTVSGWSEQITISVPLKVSLSRYTLLSRGERSTAQVTVTGAAAGQIINLGVAGDELTPLPQTDDTAIMAANDPDNGNPATGSVAAQHSAAAVEFDVIANAGSYPQGQNSARVLPAITYAGSVSSPIATPVQALVELRISVDGNTSTLRDELDEPFTITADETGNFLLYGPNDDGDYSLRFSAESHAEHSVTAGACSAQEPCLVMLDYATTVATPELSQVPGSYLERAAIGITTTTVGATLVYTLDGTTPSRDHGAVIESGAIVHLTESATLKVMAWKDGLNDSEVVVAEYVITTTEGGGGGGGGAIDPAWLLFVLALMVCLRTTAYNALAPLVTGGNAKR